MPEASHRHHLELGFRALRQFDDRRALEHVLATLTEHARDAGALKKLNVTISAFWLTVLKASMNALPPTASLEDVLERFPALTQASLPFAYYSKPLLESEECRTGVVQPDLRDLKVGPSARTPSLSLVPAIEQATHGVGLYLSEHANGSTQAEANVLAFLFAHGTTPLSLLHRSFGHRRSTLTSVLDRLERRRFVRRLHDPQDARFVLIEPTREGVVAGRRIVGVLSKLEEAARETCTDGELAAFQKVIGSIVHAVGAAR